jgi:hypothetical protein
MSDQTFEFPLATAFADVRMGNWWPWLLVAAATVIIVIGGIAFSSDSSALPQPSGEASTQPAGLAPVAP